jgi:hypothetical protein
MCAHVRRYSFGTAAQVLPIPELAPFRLTRQLRGGLQPHDARALLLQPAAAGMAALRAGAGVLEVTKPVLARLPLHAALLWVCAPCPYRRIIAMLWILRWPCQMANGRCAAAILDGRRSQLLPARER